MTFRFPFLVCMMPLLLAAGAAVGGYVLQRYKQAACLILYAAAAFIGLVFGPMLFLDRVEVTSEGITQTTGFWFVPTVKGFRFAEVESVRIETELTRNGLPNDIWRVRKHDGTVQRLNPGDLWEANTDRILPVLTQRNILVSRRE